MEKTRARFSWKEARQPLPRLAGCGINTVFDAAARRPQGPALDRVAFRFCVPDRAATFYAGRFPELYISLPGDLKNVTMAGLFVSAVGPAPIAKCHGPREAQVLATTKILSVFTFSTIANPLKP